MSNSVKIRFGTSGWRAIIADEFTFDNVRLVTQAIADYLKQSKGRSVIIGYDTRFLSGEFAQVCAQVFSGNKINVLLANRDVPTPVIAYHIINKEQAGGINFTASHNPPEYNGIKFSPSYGGPASQEITSVIEKKIARLQSAKSSFKKYPRNSDFIKIFNPRQGYLKRIKNIVDIDCIRKAQLKIAVDCMHGTSRDYIDVILRGNCRKFVLFNNYPNPLFGGLPPEPDEQYIGKLIKYVKDNKFHLGLACDGDADRFGIVDKKGVFVSPNEIFTLLLHYLLKTRPKRKRVARTLATTHMIDAVAQKEGLEVIETPVGFKYIGQALANDDCLIGGEESGGLSIYGHVPEKDGILACLLVAEMIAREKKTLSEILASLYKKYGYFYSERINLGLKQKDKKILLKRLERLSKQQTFGNLKIKKRNLNDGYKFVFNEDFWVMFRPSGTEPVVRCYFEASSKKRLAYLRAIINDFMRF